MYSCHSAVMGTLRLCPAANCSQIFNPSQAYIQLPGYYWKTAKDGSIIQIYCDFESEKFSHTSAKIKPTPHICPTRKQREYVHEHVGDNIHLQLLNISLSHVPCTLQVTGLVAHCPASSCSEIYNLFQEGLLRLSGYYWLNTPAGEVSRTHCRLDDAECGSGAWTSITHYDFSDTSTICPGNWYPISSIKACGRRSGYCALASFSTSGIQYKRVCGRVIRVQKFEITKV